MDQFEKFLDGFFLGDILLDTFLRLVERDLTTTSSYITVIGIGHLARTVHDAAHDAYLQSHEILRGCLDAGDGLLQVIERAPTTGTGDILRLRELDARCLKDGIRELI